MAHKTLIDGTSYSIVGGTTLVDGTRCKIVSGRTLINGTGYDVPLARELKSNIVTGATQVRIVYGNDAYELQGGLWYNISLSKLGLESWDQVESMKVTYYYLYYKDGNWYNINGPVSAWVSPNTKHGRTIGGYTDETYTTTMNPLLKVGSQYVTRVNWKENPADPDWMYLEELTSPTPSGRQRGSVCMYQIEYTYWE